MPTPRERAEEKRRQKLEDVERQKESGELVVRQMTDEEREKFPKLTEEEQEKRRTRRRRS
ncbi:MAG: hypothetical protein QOE86_2384 [Solirubrobacteraceae bacterium]|jgi:hypothetical protein|nr:hypothetical protein [Solirubrobacteraceae bacterium]